MSTIPSRKTLLAITTAAALSIAGLTTSAQAAENQPDPVQALVDHAFEGTLTNTERKILIAEYPEIAAVVPDLSRLEIRTVEVPAASGGIMPLATTKCSTYSGWNTLKSLLGFTIYKFTHKATACSDGTRITSHSQPTFTISEADTTVDSWSVVDKSVSGVNTGTSTSRLQVRVQQCVVKYGCYATHYPTGTIVAKANNTATITTTER